MIVNIGEEKKSQPIHSSYAAADIFRTVLALEDEVDKDKEHLWVIGLNCKNIVSYVELVALGTLTENLVHPREVFRMAIMKAVMNIIVGHNHPSGNPEPSEKDNRLTDRLRQSGEILGIQLLDHIIIGNGNYKHSSLKDISGRWKWELKPNSNAPKNKKSKETAKETKEMMEMGKAIGKKEGCEMEKPEKLKPIKDIKVRLRCQGCGAGWSCILKTDNSTSKDSRKCPNGCDAKIEADVTSRNIIERYNLSELEQAIRA
jgi:DNA repair protein RadC